MTRKEQKKMLIDDDRELIFIHVPRTGGNSIKRALTGGPKPPARLNGYEFYCHCDIEKVKGYCSPDKFNSYTKIGVIRNPYDYCVSWYEYLKYLKPSYQQLSFLKFLTEVGYRWHTSGEEFNEFKNMNIKPQISWLKGEDGELLADQVWDYEDLAKTLEITYSLKLPDVNINPERPNKPYRSYYSKETMNWVNKHFEDDLETFGYVF